MISVNEKIKTIKLRHNIISNFVIYKFCIEIDRKLGSKANILICEVRKKRGLSYGITNYLSFLEGAL